MEHVILFGFSACMTINVRSSYQVSGADESQASRDWGLTTDWYL